MLSPVLPPPTNPLPSRLPPPLSPSFFPHFLVPPSPSFTIPPATFSSPTFPSSSRLHTFIAVGWLQRLPPPPLSTPLTPTPSSSYPPLFSFIFYLLLATMRLLARSLDVFIVDAAYVDAWTVYTLDTTCNCGLLRVHS